MERLIYLLIWEGRNLSIRKKIKLDRVGMGIHFPITTLPHFDSGFGMGMAMHSYNQGGDGMGVAHSIDIRDLQW